MEDYTDGSYNYRKIALFSGKFSIVHAGHLATIIDLANQYKAVKVAILQYSGRSVTVECALSIFNHILQRYPNVSYYIGNIHFGRITLEQLKTFYPFDVYCSGNMDVLLHLEQLGVPIRYVNRSFGYKSSNPAIE